MTNEKYADTGNEDAQPTGCGSAADANERNAAESASGAADAVEPGYDLETHGGGGVEAVPGFNLFRPMLDGLSRLETAPLPERYQAMIDAGAAHYDGGAPRESVCGRDDRVRISAVTTPPWRMIAKLFITAGDGAGYVGTGWFIAPRVLVTAGHCVHSKRSGGWAKSIEVVPGMDGRQRPFGSAVSRQFRSVKHWTEGEAVAHDYGCIVLSEGDRLGDKTGWFGFASHTDAQLRNLLVNTAGYPADKSVGTQWFNAGRVTSFEPDRIGYMVDTFGGQSGSAVWRYDAATRSRNVVGVHNYGGCNNWASRITPGLFERLKVWKSLGA